MSAGEPITKTKLFFLLTLGLHLLFASKSLAQPRIDQEAKLGLSYVLSFKGVAKDLELSESQNDQLIGSWIEVKRNLETAFRNYKMNYSPRLSSEEKRELENSLAEEIKKVRENETKKLDKVLLPHQVERLKQIQFQILRRDSDGMPGLAEALKLTKDQLKKFKSLKTELAKSIQNLKREARTEQLTPNEVMEKLETIQSQSSKDVEKVLSDEQRRKLKKLEGEPFKLHTAATQKPKH